MLYLTWFSYLSVAHDVTTFFATTNQPDANGKHELTKPQDLIICSYENTCFLNMNQDRIAFHKSPASIGWGSPAPSPVGGGARAPGGGGILPARHACQECKVPAVLTAQ